MAKDKVQHAMEETNVLEKEEADLLLEHQSIQSRADAMKSEEEALAQGVARWRLGNIFLCFAYSIYVQYINNLSVPMYEIYIYII